MCGCVCACVCLCVGVCASVYVFFFFPEKCIFAFFLSRGDKTSSFFIELAQVPLGRREKQNKTKLEAICFTIIM